MKKRELRAQLERATDAALPYVTKAVYWESVAAGHREAVTRALEQVAELEAEVERLKTRPFRCPGCDAFIGGAIAVFDKNPSGKAIFNQRPIQR